MAVLLKRQYNLVALKVVLKTRGDTASIQCVLELTEEHEPRPVYEGTFSAADIGLPACFEHRGRQSPYRQDPQTVDDYRFQLPDSFVRGIQRVLDIEEYDGPIWLHLVKPYGQLGILPWEALLAGTERPILRLPDALADPPVEAPQSLDVAICASRPVSEMAFSIPEYLCQMAESIVRAVPERTVRVHVFSDLECVLKIRSILSAKGLLDSSVIVHDPHTAEGICDERRRRNYGRRDPVSNPWLLWMRESLKGRCVDVVHFLCHGYLADSGGALAFAEGPARNGDPRWSQFVEGADLGVFLLQVGAWCLAFSSPEQNFSEAGLRALADEFAQVRPSPVLYHECGLDPDFSHLAMAYEFLFGHKAISPPQSPALALCCQPFLVRKSVLAGKAADRNLASFVAESAAGSATPDQISAAAALACRFVEQKEYDLRKTRKTLESRNQSRADLEGIERGVDEIRETLARLAKKGLL